jgi:hypothetical protein
MLVLLKGGIYGVCQEDGLKHSVIQKFTRRDIQKDTLTHTDSNVVS